MGYGAALPAGSYGGPLGAYRRRRMEPSSHVGATIRDNIKARALGGVGLGNLCTDPAAAFTQAIIGGAGAIVAGTSEGELMWDSKTGSWIRTGGSTAGTITGGSLSTVSDAWGATCAADAAASSDATAGNMEMWQAQLDAQRAATERQIAEQRRTTEQTLQTLMMMQAQQGRQEAQSGIDTNTLLIAGGVALGVVALALVLRR
jgi:hypothetical protein